MCDYIYCLLGNGIQVQHNSTCAHQRVSHVIHVFILGRWMHLLFVGDLPRVTGGGGSGVWIHRAVVVILFRLRPGHANAQKPGNNRHDWTDKSNVKCSPEFISYHVVLIRNGKEIVVKHTGVPGHRSQGQQSCVAKCSSSHFWWSYNYVYEILSSYQSLFF